MPYESALALGLKPYTAGEQPKDRQFIKLNTNENPYPPSPRAVAVLEKAAERLRLYPDMESTALREAIAQVNGVAPEQVFCGNGSDEVLAFAFAAFFAGKQVAAPQVSYSFYPVYAQLFSAQLEQVALRDDFTIPVEAMCKGMPVVLANPNAPTGIALTNDELRVMAQHAREHDAILLVDEAYAAFAQENAVPLLSEFDNVLIVRTFSKSHALAGMRVGYAMGSVRLINALCSVRDSFNSYPVDCLAQAAAREAILDVDYTAHTAALVVEARDRCRERLLAAGIDVLPSRTNFLFVRADETDAGPVQSALRAEGILVRHFTAPLLKPWLRVTIGTTEDMETVTEALIRCIRG